MSFRVLGLDPGFASFGWAVVQLDPELRLVELGVVRTEKAKTKGLVSTDLRRRAQELVHALDVVLVRHRPACICAESLSLPRNASVGAQLGRAWGVIDAAAWTHRLAVIERSPQAIKRATAGKKTASKDEVLEALDAIFAGDLRRQLEQIRARTQWEHPTDAVGAVMASLDDDALRLARSARAQEARA